MKSLSYGWLNVGSFMLGLVAWVLPIIMIIKTKKGSNVNALILSVLSMCACTVSLWFQIIYNDHLVKIEDWSALMDTTGALVIVSSVLIIVTIILNLLSLFLYKKGFSK